MKKAEMKPFRESLLQLRARLRGDVEGMAKTALAKASRATESGFAGAAGSGGDWDCDVFEQHNTLRLLDNDGEVLSAIEGALERIAEGVYGSCVGCEQRIPKLRLKAIPYTPYCVKCASEIESGERV